jgi:hypothetical protein
MSNIFLRNSDSPADALEHARAILNFSQSWLIATHDNKPEPHELYGFSLVLEAVEALVVRAEEELRNTERGIIA